MNKETKQQWIVYGFFIEFICGVKKGIWCEIKKCKTYEDALKNARSINNEGVILNSYSAFKIIERTYTDEKVFDSRE